MFFLKSCLYKYVYVYVCFMLFFFNKTGYIFVSLVIALLIAYWFYFKPEIFKFLYFAQ